ncbi:MAG: hypothetical protein JWP87_1644 [Labilithrix sp.]|nr:hypothetical protein [Labilithrix sp.]
MLEAVRLYLFVFGVLTIAGGILGFVKAKSRASLIAGTVSGVLLLVAGYEVSARGTVGLVIGLVVSLALAARFGAGFQRTRKVMPAGLMALLGFVGVIVTVLGLLER